MGTTSRPSVATTRSTSWARNYPKVGIPTFAVTGDDHEGWYIRREGIDIGRYCESVMRDAGHDWHNLGYMEADIVLQNANSGKTAIVAALWRADPASDLLVGGRGGRSRDRL